MSSRGKDPQGAPVMSPSTLDVVTLLFFFFFYNTEPDRKSERLQCSRRKKKKTPQATSTVTETTTRWARRLDGDGGDFQSRASTPREFSKGLLCVGGGGELLLTVRQAELQSLQVSPAAERRRGRAGRGSYGHTPAAAGSCRKGRGAAPDP